MKISNVQLKKQKQLMFLNWHINIGYIDLEVIYCVHMPQNQTYDDHTQEHHAMWMKVGHMMFFTSC